MLKTLAKYPEAIAALETGLKCDGLKNHPESAQQMYFEMGNLCESVERFGPAADAFNKAAEILEHPDLIMAKGNIPREAILARAAETYEKIGQLYRKAKRYDDALAALAKAQKHAPGNAAHEKLFHGANMPGAGKLCASGRPCRRVSEHPAIEHRSVRHEDRSAAPLETTRTHRSLARRSGGAGSPRSRELQLVLAQEFANAKQPKKAETLYKKLAEDSPSADLYRGLFRLYKDEGTVGMTPRARYARQGHRQSDER